MPSRSTRRAAAGTALAILLLSVLGFAADADAQAWPSRPMRLLIGQAAGGAADAIARAVADGLTSSLGQPVVVENRPGGGAGGILAVTLVGQAQPDGYTLGLGTSGPLGAGPAIAKVPWDPVNGFTHISLVSESFWFLISSPTLPAGSVSELIKLIRANPGKFNYGSDGIGSTSHLAIEWLKLREKLFIVHIPYVTAAARIQGMLASDIHVMMYNPSATMDAFAKEGKIRILAVTSPNRLAGYPGIPTTAEAGLPGFEVASWFSVFAPPGLPRDMQLRLNKEVAGFLQRPDIRARIVAAGQLIVRSNSPEEMAAYIGVQNRQWKEVVQKAGIRLEE